MISLDHAVAAGGPLLDRLDTMDRRHYRGRNQLSTRVIDWNTGTTHPADPPYWDDMFDGSIRIGIRAAKRTFKPGMVIWALMASIAALYYLAPWSHRAFASLVALQNATGVLFPSLGMGLSVGILVELVKVACSPDKRWTRGNSRDAIFNFAVFGVMGITHYYRFAFQNDVFGADNSFSTLAAKVAFDQFIWTVLIANPYQSVLFLWKNRGFSWHAVRRSMTPVHAFWGTQMLPVLIANWAFWIPMAFLVYYFPADLQLPLSILAVTAWVMLLTMLTSQSNRHDDA